MEVFWSLIEPLLDSRQPRRICEIGLEAGALTARLLGWARENGGEYVGIDPAPAPALSAMIHPPETVHRAHSLDVLPQLAPCDVYFIDGDHNYHTVSGELAAIARAGGGAGPLIFVHDVGWPWGRRDMYYDPAVIPETARHASSDSLGVELGSDALVDGGLRAPGVYHIALHAGGPRNGVLTAVEDFLAGEAGRGWEAILIACAYGLAVLQPPGELPAGCKEGLRELRSAATMLGPFLHDLEANCLVLYLYGEHMKHTLEQTRAPQARGGWFGRR